jgi:type I restriction enzyme S subunit
VDKLSPEYLGCALVEREPEIEMLGSGSTGQTELSRQRLAELELVVPPRDLAETFATTIRPLNSKRVASWQESTTLAELRDLLLPKLMSGEIRLKDADKAVEEML